MRRFVTLIFLILASNALLAKEVLVEVLYGTNTKSVIVQMSKGLYEIHADEEKIFRFDGNDKIELQVVGNKVSLEKNSIHLGIYKNIAFKTLDPAAYLKVTGKSSKQYYYQDNLWLRGLVDRLQIINEVELNHYVAGVIESEIGNVRDSELLKVQAVISRTYALRHLERHKTEKVQLCDRVHCQVYHGRARFNPMIEAAVDSTHYEVIVDEKGNLIEAVFHANCGGQTVNSEDVWTLKRDYLRSVTDTFCVKSRQASWEKEIEKGAWLNYLSKKSGQTISDPCAFNHLDRLNSMPCCSVRMEDLRLEFGLKSTYFYVDEYPEKVMLVGRGFGHGVGMCQDGSIEMARLGKDYQSIIRYYYTSIQIKNWK